MIYLILIGPVTELEQKRFIVKRIYRNIFFSLRQRKKITKEVFVKSR